MMRISPSTKASFIRDHANGDSVVTIATRYNVSRDTVYRALKSYRKYGEAGLKPAPTKPHSSPRKTSEALERKVIHVWERSQIRSFAEVTRKLNADGVRISRPTVTRIIKEHLGSQTNERLHLDRWNDKRRDEALERRLKKIGRKDWADLGITHLVELYFKTPLGRKKSALFQKIVEALPPIKILD